MEQAAALSGPDPRSLRKRRRAQLHQRPGVFDRGSPGRGRIRRGAVAKPLGAFLELSDRPPTRRIEPVRQGQQTHGQQSPQIAVFVMRQFVTEDQSALPGGQPPPGGFRHDDPIARRPAGSRPAPRRGKRGTEWRDSRRATPAVDAIARPTLHRDSRRPEAAARIECNATARRRHTRSCPSPRAREHIAKRS